MAAATTDQRRDGLRVVILAAGKGKRLLPHTQTIPKTMVAVGGRPLLLRTLSTLVDDSRIEDILVIGGYRFDVLEAGLATLAPKVRAVFNPAYEVLGPQASVLEGIGDSWSGEELLVVNGDTFFEEGMTRRVLDATRRSHHSMTLFGSRADAMRADDIQVALAPDGMITAVGKNLVEGTARRSCGILHVRTAPSIEAIRKAMRESLEASEATWHGALNRVIDREGRIAFEEVPADEWLEIDTPDDLERCNAGLLARHDNR